MRLVVNHLTRMSAPRICVAGIDVESMTHVRSTTPPSDLITRSLLREEGGPLRVGALVDLGEVTPEPQVPETEDHRFATTHLRHIRDLDGDEYVELLERCSVGDLATAFGPDLQRVGWKYAVEAGSGRCSLAVVSAREMPELQIDDRYGKPRLQCRFNDVEPPTFIPVTDLRFYEQDNATIRTDVVDDVNRRLASGVPTFLMLGLARAYKGTTDDRERHWLQLNGVCLVDRPCGDLP